MARANSFYTSPAVYVVGVYSRSARGGAAAAASVQGAGRGPPVAVPPRRRRTERPAGPVSAVRGGTGGVAVLRQPLGGAPAAGGPASRPGPRRGARVLRRPRAGGAG